MPSDALANELATHIPRWVSSYLGRGGDRVADPVVEKRPVALLLIDIAGFSAATDKFPGRRAEELNDLLNDCFAALTNVLEAHGGDILAFAGDAILAIWDVGDLKQATARAAQCGLVLREVMEECCSIIRRR
jgi:adenylate cyclase